MLKFRVMRFDIFWIVVTLVSLLFPGGCAHFSEETTRCPVHEKELVAELVGVRDGMPRLEYERARKEAFPFSGTVFSGEIRPGNTQEHAQVKVCRECRRAEAEWVRENRWK
jgi:hypothetical protein